MEIGYLADVFDLLNVRDLDVIDQAASHCAHLVVGVYTDEYAQQLLGYAPVVPFVERFELVSHVRGVASVRMHDEQVPAPGPIFRLADRVAGSKGGTGPVLTPRRVTASPVLKNALLPAHNGLAA